MKMRLRALIYTITVVALSACNGADDLIASSSVEAQIHAELPIDELTRSDVTSFAANNKIGVTGRYTENGATKTMNSANLCYYLSNTSTGKWLPDGDDNKFLFQNSSSVKFSAYYPYSSSVGDDGSITIDDTQDYLYAEATGSETSPTVALTNFAHCLSKLTFTFTAGTGVTAANIKNLSFTLSGLKHSGTFNILTGKATANSSATTSDVTMNTTSSLTTKALPQTATLKITLSLGGSTYTANIGSVTLVGGNEYTYNITVKRTGLTVSTNSISSWTSGASATQTAVLQSIGSITDYSKVSVGDFAYSDGSFDPSSTTLSSDKKKLCIGVVYYTLYNKKIFVVIPANKTLTHDETSSYASEYLSSSWGLASNSDYELIADNLATINASLSIIGYEIYYNICNYGVLDSKHIYWSSTVDEDLKDEDGSYYGNYPIFYFIYRTEESKYDGGGSGLKLFDNYWDSDEDEYLPYYYYALYTRTFTK
jgi:phosphotransferase system IIB component